MRLRLFSLCLAAGLFAGQQASAETITMSLYQPSGGYPNGVGTVKLDGNAITGAPIGPLYWSQFASNGQPYEVPPNTNFPNQVSTFCIELGMDPANQIAPGTPYTFGVKDPLATLGETKTNALLNLYDQHYNPAWANYGFTGSPESTAFQLAVWEIVYDGLSSTDTSLTDGRFSLNVSDYDAYRGGAGSLAQDWLEHLSGTYNGGTQVVVLQAPANEDGKIQTPTQDQITFTPKPVPAPPGLVLAGIGFVGLLGRGRWLRRKAVAA